MIGEMYSQCKEAQSRQLRLELNALRKMQYDHHASNERHSDLCRQIDAIDRKLMDGRAMITPKHGHG